MLAPLHPATLPFQKGKFANQNIKSLGGVVSEICVMVKIIDGEVVHDDDPRLKKAFQMPAFDYNKVGLVLFIAYIAVLNLPQAIQSTVGGYNPGSPGEVREISTLKEATRLMKYHKVGSTKKTNNKESHYTTLPGQYRASFGDGFLF